MDLKTFDKPIFYRHKHAISDYVQVVGIMFCVYLCAFVVAFSVCFTSSYVYGESMKPTINNYTDYEHNKDIVYINKTTSYTYGDIIVIQKDASTQIIKRVIALPGDRINIIRDGSRYYTERNGTILDEDGFINVVSYDADYNGMYKVYKAFQQYKQNHFSELNFEDPTDYANSAIIVGEGEVFVLGDNRHNSEDSSRDGCFKASAVVGRVDIIVYSNESVLLSLLNYFYNPFK